MEDRAEISVAKLTDKFLYGYFGVFDGHGGAEMSEAAKQKLLHYIVDQNEFWSQNDDLVCSAIKMGFLKFHNKMLGPRNSWKSNFPPDLSTAGSTASVLFLKNDKIYIGHVGDSAIVMGLQEDMDNKSGWSSSCLTVAHKPDSVNELERITRSGGKVAVDKKGFSRVVWNRLDLALGRRVQFPFLAMSRALGDYWSFEESTQQYAVSPEPDVSVHSVDKKSLRCIILATDGVFDVLSPQNAVNLVQKSIQEEDEVDEGKECVYVGSPVKATANAGFPATFLVEAAREKWLARGKTADNMAAIVIQFDCCL